MRQVWWSKYFISIMAGNFYLWLSIFLLKWKHSKTTYNNEHAPLKQNGWMKELHDPKHSKEYGCKGSITLLFVDRGNQYNYLLDEL